jgi:hypothetical protein
VLRIRFLLPALLLTFAALPSTLAAQLCSGMVQIGLYSEQSGSPVAEGDLVDVQFQTYSYSSGQMLNCDVNWSVSGPGRILTEDQYGARIRVGAGPGTLTVTARLRGGSGRYASLRFAVLETPMLLELRPDTLNLAVGEQKKPDLLLTTGSGDTYALHEAKWESDNPAVAAVDSTGTVRGVAAGTASVKATIELSNGERQRSAAAVVKVGGG